MKKAGKVVAITFVSQVIVFLNLIYLHFRGTLFGFVEWETMASQSALIFGLVVVVALVSRNLGISKGDLQKRVERYFIATLIMFVVCGAIYSFIKSGYAPTDYFVYVLRDIVWMIVYIVTMVMVSVTLAFGQLLLLWPAR